MKKKYLLFLLAILFASLLMASEYFVLGEVFTRPNCPYCPSAQLGLSQLFDQHERVIPLVWYVQYSGSPYLSPGESQRRSLYNFSGVPHAQFGGSIATGGGYPSPGSMYSNYLSNYNQLIGYDSPLEISMFMNVNNSGQLVVSTLVTVTGTINAEDSNRKLITVLTIDDNVYPRFYVIGYHEQSFEQSVVGSSQEYTQVFDLQADWDVEDLRAVSFVQSFASSKRVLQAGSCENEGVVARFTASTTQGPPELVVQFRNMSYLPMPILSYAWSFNGNGTVDSTDPNPVWSFTEPGSYDVTLTILTDEGEVSATKENFITVLSPSNVSGGVSGVWSSEYSPYVITGNIVINDNTSLVINPGAKLIFTPDTELVVNGELRVLGSEDNFVEFTSNTDWRGLYILSPSSLIEINYAKFEKAAGGAIRASSTNMLIEGCVFTNNRTSLSEPGAINLSNCPDVIIQGSYFANNHSDRNSGTINASGSNLIFRNNVVVNNSGQNSGGLMARNSSNITIENCTFYNNLSNGSSGATIFNTSSQIEILNSIINGEAPIFNMLTAQTSISYSCLSVEYPGEGNISVDPRFVRESTAVGSNVTTDYPDWVLADDSPCIDAGNPDASFNDIADPDNPNNALFPAKGTIRNDMGAFGGSRGMYWVSEIEQHIPNVRSTNISIKTYPNPFKNNLTINVSMKEINQPVNVSIYNVKGQKITELMNAVPKSNDFSLNWNLNEQANSKLSSGIYFVRVNTPGDNSTQKVLFLK